MKVGEVVIVGIFRLKWLQCEPFIRYSVCRCTTDPERFWSHCL